MTKELRTNTNRRELLRGTLRYGALGAIAAASTAAVFKRRKLVREGKCLSKGICRGCEAFDKCGLPAALSVKNVLGINK